MEPRGVRLVKLTITMQRALVKSEMLRTPLDSHQILYLLTVCWLNLSGGIVSTESTYNEKNNCIADSYGIYDHFYLCPTRHQIRY